MACFYKKKKIQLFQVLTFLTNKLNLNSVENEQIISEYHRLQQNYQEFQEAKQIVQYSQSQNQIKPISAMSIIQEPTKQIKQYKQFTTLTSIRKATQQAIGPTIKSLELQISNLMDENKDLNKRVSKLDDVFKAQNYIEQRINQTNKIIRDFKDEQAQKRKQDQRKSSKLDSANQKLFLQMHSLKMSLQSQQQIIKQMNNKNIKNAELFTNLNATHEKFTKQLQFKYSDFSRQILDSTRQMKKQYHLFQGQIQGMRQTFRLQRQAIEQKSKPLQLFFSQRQSINDKFDDLYVKIQSNVTNQHFENYRKSQKALFQEQIAAIKNQIQQILPQSLRKLFPTVQKKIKQVDKIKILQKHIQAMQLKLDSINKKINETKDQVIEKIQVVRQQNKQQSMKIQYQVSLKLKQIQEKQANATITVQQKIQQMKIQIQQEVSEMLEKQTSEIHKTIQAEVALNKSMNKNQGMMSSAQYEQFLQYVQQVHQIKQKILGRYKKIQELGQTIDKKIQNYSNRIVKIKSDYQLFADNMRKQVSGVIRFRDTFLDRLKDIGKLISTYSQALFIIASTLIQQSQQQNNHSNSQKQQIVFITDYDGIVFEYKPQNQKGFIYYRKQKMEIRQFLRSFMYSLINFTDQNICNLEFLNWKDNKPSCFFKERMLVNYRTNLKRISEHAHKKKAKSSSFYSTPSNQNQPFFNLVQTDPTIFNNDPTSSAKLISKTIDSKARLDRVLEQGNLLITNEQNKRIYSIKKTKPFSGRPKSKQKVTNDMSRYQQTFLTSRSACRSRISQLI